MYNGGYTNERETMIRLKNLMEESGSLTIRFYSFHTQEMEYEKFDLIQAKELINYGINNQYLVMVNGERFSTLIEWEETNI